jgi:hypothetical protein
MVWEQVVIRRRWFLGGGRWVREEREGRLPNKGSAMGTPQELGNHVVAVSS